MTFDVTADPPVNFLKKKIEEKLFNYPSDFLNDEMKKFEFEQYKLIIDSVHKMEERRNGSNNIFVALNSIFATVLTQIVPYPNPNDNIEKLIILSLLLPIGMIICWDWLRTIEAYKRLNSINFLLVKTLEKSLPLSLFGLRTELMDEPDLASKANTILKKETLLPVIFMAVYSLYFMVVIGFMFF